MYFKAANKLHFISKVRCYDCSSYAYIHIIPDTTKLELCYETNIVQNARPCIYDFINAHRAFMTSDCTPVH